MAFRPQIIRSAALSLLACALPLANTATAMASRAHPDTTTLQAPVAFVAADAEPDEDGSDYGQWLADSVMPLLDSASPDRLVSRQEFVFILEAIALQRIQNVTNEVDAVTDYCDTHIDAARYLERRIPSFKSESERLISSARHIATQARSTSPLQPLWRRKKLDTQLSSQTYLKQSKGDETSSEVSNLPSTIDPNLPYFIRFFNYYFGEGTFEIDAFRPTQPVTHGDLIDYFSRQDTQFSRALEPLVVEDVPGNYSEARVANRVLSIVLEDVAEIRALTEELRRAVARAQAQSQPQIKSVEGSIFNKNAQQISQSNSIPSILFIEEIPDVSPTDPIYTPLKIFVEEFGIDMAQSDGNFNGDEPLTREELARYIEPIFFENGFFSLTATCESVTDEYGYWSHESQLIQSALREAIAELN